MVKVQEEDIQLVNDNDEAIPSPPSQEEQESLSDDKEIKVKIHSSDDEGAVQADEEAEKLREEIAQLKEENSSLKDMYLRKQAEFENFRKRMTREKQEAIRFSNTDLILDLVSIIDDFERAIKSADESQDFESFKEGISMIESQFVGMLEKKWGLQRITAQDEEFDPQQHEAMMMEEREDHDTSRVLEVYQRGYKLHDRVIRPSKVKVSRPAENK